LKLDRLKEELLENLSCTRRKRPSIFITDTPSKQPPLDPNATPTLQAAEQSTSTSPTE